MKIYPKIIIFTTKDCQECEELKAFLDKEKRDYQEVFLSTKKDQKKFFKISEQLKFPTVIVGKERVFVGFSKKDTFTKRELKRAIAPKEGDSLNDWYAPKDAELAEEREEFPISLYQ